jgi:hypothetical protein
MVHNSISIWAVIHDLRRAIALTEKFLEGVAFLACCSWITGTLVDVEDLDQTLS